MKIIGLSLRVDQAADRAERRDGIDQRWYEFFQRMNWTPILIPNHKRTVESLIKEIPFDGFVLSGGNDLTPLGGQCPEREQAESVLLSHAMTNDLPLLGVCHGMQMLVHHLGGNISAASGHVGTRHRIRIENSEREVNSFHKFCVTSTPGDLLAIAHSDDGHIEAVRHRTHPILAVMWHPERESPIHPLDLKMVQSLFEAQP